MGLLSGFARFSAIVVLLIAVLAGFLLSGIPGKLGFFRFIVSLDPRLQGQIPLVSQGTPWGYTFEQLDQVDLTGQTALVTGANSGLGYETALALARLGATVTLACRTPSKCDAAAATIRGQAHPEAEVRAMKLDVSSLASVREFATAFLADDRPLDMLFLNAGIASARLNSTGGVAMSEDGIELIFATNHVGHHLLYSLLEPRVKAAEVARVVLTSSAANYEAFSYGVATDIETLNGVPAVQGFDFPLYGQSKLAQILFVQEVTERLGPDSSVYVNSYHPGAVSTGVWPQIWNANVEALLGWAPDVVIDSFEHVKANLMWSGAEGALTGLYLGVATHEIVEKDIRGKYFHPIAHMLTPNALAGDRTLQKDVWRFTEELISMRAPVDPVR